MNNFSEWGLNNVRNTDWQSFIIALVVIIGGGYGLLFDNGIDPGVKTAVAGFIGSVLTYFFGRQVGAAASANVARQVDTSIKSQNGGSH